MDRLHIPCATRLLTAWFGRPALQSGRFGKAIAATGNSSRQRHILAAKRHKFERLSSVLFILENNFRGKTRDDCFA
jgi:hypothetical protein